MSDWKDHVRLATTANISPFPPSTLVAVDGVTPADNDRVLVKNQTNAAANGIYVATSHGGTWTRALDAKQAGDLAPEMTVRVSEGATNSGTAWRLVTTGAITVGTTPLAFAPMSTSVANIDALRNIAGDRASVVTVRAHTTAGDGGEGEFAWQVGAPPADDGGVNIVATGVSSGWWRRRGALSQSVNVKWFGAVGDNVTDDRAAIQRALDFAYSRLSNAGGPNISTYFTPEVFLPRGNYAVGRASGTYGAHGYYHGVEVLGLLTLRGESGGDGTVITQHASVAPRKAITGASSATPVVMTVPGHGFENDQVIEQRGVHGNTAANGRFVVKNKTVDTYELYLQSGQPVASSGTFDPSAGADGFNRPPVAYDSGIALVRAQHYKNRFEHIQFLYGRHAIAFYGYFANGTYVGSNFNPAGTGSRITQCSFIYQNGYSIWHDMSPVTHPQVVRSCQDWFIEDCRHLGPNFVWMFCDHLEVAGGTLNLDQTFLSGLDITRLDAAFPEIGNPDGLPLPYIVNPDNTWVHEFMFECLGVGPRGVLFGPGNVSFYDLEQFDGGCTVMRTKSSGTGYKGAGGEAPVPIGYGTVSGFLHARNVLFNTVGRNFIEVYDDFPAEIKINGVLGLNSSLSNGIFVYQDPAGVKSITGCTFTGATLRMTVAGHGYSDGEIVVQRSVGGPQNALGSFKIAVVDADHYDIYREWGQALTLDKPYTGGGTVCKSGHVDLTRAILEQQGPIYYTTDTVSGAAGLTIDDDTPNRAGSFTKARYGSDPTGVTDGTPNGTPMNDMLEAYKINRPFEEISNRYGPRNNLFLPGLVSSQEGDPHVNPTVVRVNFSVSTGASWLGSDDTSKGYTLRKYTVSGGNGGSLAIFTPAWGANMPAGIYTFLWEAKVNFTGHWYCRWWHRDDVLAGGCVREFGPNDDFVQFAFSFWHAGGPGHTMRLVLSCFNVPPGGVVVPGNWMIVKGRAPNGVPYTMPVDDAVSPPTNTVSPIQPHVYFATAKPAAGQYAKGDIVVNVDPADDEFAAWTCTAGSVAGGAPAFLGFGHISTPAWVQKPGPRASLRINGTTEHAYWDTAHLVVNADGVPGSGFEITNPAPAGFLVLRSSSGNYLDSSVNYLRDSAFDVIAESYGPNTSQMEGFRIRNWKTVSLNDLPAGGSIGAPASTVDAFNGVRVNQTTPGQTLSLPAPTHTMNGKMLAVMNVGTQPFTLLGATVAPGTTLLAFWDALAWSKVV